MVQAALVVIGGADQRIRIGGDVIHAEYGRGTVAQ